MKLRSANSPTSPYRGAQAVHRAVALLKAFSDARPEWALTDLAREVGLNKTTAHRLLAALEDERMLARSPGTDAYRLGPEAIVMGARALRAHDLRAAAHAELEALAREVGETTTLEVLMENDVMILDEVAGPNLLGPTPSIGTRWPAHATSTGKVLLAARHQQEDFGESDAGWKGLRLERRTEHTITSVSRLRAELARVREQGYATAIEELEVGHVAVGGPIRNHERSVIAAVSVGGPAGRITTERIPRLAAAVRRAADRISQQLGAPSGEA